MAERTLLATRLDQLIKERAIVDVDRDGLDCETLVGTILQHSPHVFVMEKLDDGYEADGVVAARPRDITRIRSGGRELAAGDSVARRSTALELFAEVALLEITSAMTLFEQRFGYVTLHAERPRRRTCFIGQVIELDDELIRMNEYGTFKRMDRRELLIRVDENHAGGRYERKLIEAFAKQAR